jgi:hypothetical protein
VLPKAYSSPDASYDGFYNDMSISRAGGTCIDYCPYTPDAFLVGFRDGKIGYGVVITARALVSMTLFRYLLSAAPRHNNVSMTLFRCLLSAAPRHNNPDSPTARSHSEGDT